METLTTIRPELLSFTAEQFRALAPLIWVFGGTLIALIAAVMKSPKWPVFGISVLTALAGVAASWTRLSEAPLSLFNGMMVMDPYANFFGILFMASALMTILASFRYLDRENLQHPEYYILVLFSAIGMMLMVSALDLVVIFIALELMSLTVYSLVGFRRADRRSNEAAMKYFILGGAASAVLLYGAALLYGATGTTNIQKILGFVQAGSEVSGLFTLGAWFVIVGFLFKVATVPFHMWMPDVYEGAPTPITGFMTTGVKAASFGAFVRVFMATGYGHGLAETVQEHLHHILWVTAVLTIVIGNLVALTQTNLKRMLAYSSIAHSGYIMVGFLTGAFSDQGYAPVVLYLVVYSAMNLGAFTILTILSGRNDEGLNLHDMAGISRRHPWLSFAMAVFLFSMAGVPPTAGFIAKYMLFYSAVQAGEVLLVVLSVLGSVISVYYYLRVLVYMYMREPVGAPANLRVSLWASVAVAVMVLITLQVGVMPAPLVEAAKRAIVGM